MTETRGKGEKGAGIYSEQAVDGNNWNSSSLQDGRCVLVRVILQLKPRDYSFIYSFIIIILTFTIPLADVRYSTCISFVTATTGRHTQQTCVASVGVAMSDGDALKTTRH